MTPELIAWSEAIVLVVIAVAALYYKIGRGQKAAPKVTTPSNGRVSKTDFDARVILVDGRIDYVHQRLDEQKDVLSGISVDVGYIRGKIE